MSKIIDFLYENDLIKTSRCPQDYKLDCEIQEDCGEVCELEPCEDCWKQALEKKEKELEEKDD